MNNLKRQVLDVDVEVVFNRRDYQGKERKDSERFRLVAVYNADEEKYHLRWGTIFSEKAGYLLTAILNYLGIRHSFETSLSVYSSEALDPHVNRKCFTEEWWALTDDIWGLLTSS